MMPFLLTHIFFLVVYFGRTNRHCREKGDEGNNRTDDPTSLCGSFTILRLDSEAILSTKASIWTFDVDNNNKRGGVFFAHPTLQSLHKRVTIITEREIANERRASSDKRVLS